VIPFEVRDEPDIFLKCLKTERTKYCINYAILSASIKTKPGCRNKSNPTSDFFFNHEQTRIHSATGSIRIIVNRTALSVRMSVRWTEDGKNASVAALYSNAMVTYRGSDVRIDSQLSFDRIVNICCPPVAPRPAPDAQSARSKCWLSVDVGVSDISSGQALMDYLTRRADTGVIIQCPGN